MSEPAEITEDEYVCDFCDHGECRRCRDIRCTCCYGQDGPALD